MRRTSMMAVVGAVVALTGALGGGAGGVGGVAVGQEPTTTTTTVPVAAPGATVPVVAGSPEAVAAGIVDKGWYADPGSVGDREQLDAVALRLASRGEPLGFALLDEEPAGSSTVFAEEVLDILVGRGGTDVRTVVVLSDADVGVVSDVWGDDAIDEALDETIDDLRADPTDGLESLADALVAQPTGEFDSDSDSGGGDSSSATTGWLVLALIVIVVFSLASRSWSGRSGEGGYDSDDGGTDSLWGSSSSRRRRPSFRRSTSSHRSSSSRSSSRRSSSSSRGRGGRRL